MTLFILSETPAGYALLKARDKKLLQRDDLAEESSTAEGVCGLLRLSQFRKFESATSALEEAAALTEGKVSVAPSYQTLSFTGINVSGTPVRALGSGYNGCDCNMETDCEITIGHTNAIQSAQ